MKINKTLPVGTLLLAIFTSFSSHAACYPRCWGGESLLSGEPYTDTGSVVNKAYEYGLEIYLSPGENNQYGSDAHLYAIREVLLMKPNHAAMVSKAYNYLWPNININYSNVGLYHELFSDLIPKATEFVNAVNGNFPPNYSQQQVIDSSLATKIRRVINANKGITSDLDQLLLEIETVLGEIEGMKPVELMTYGGISSSTY